MTLRSHLLRLAVGFSFVSGAWVEAQVPPPLPPTAEGRDTALGLVPGDVANGHITVPDALAGDPALLATQLAALPGEALADPREHYVASNEWRHDLWFDDVRDLGGAYVGVGSDQNYTLAAVQDARLVFLVDFDPTIPRLHRVYGALVRASATAAELLACVRDARAMQRVLDAGLEGDPERDLLLRLARRHRPRLARYLGAVARGRSGATWLSDVVLYARVRALFEAGRIVARAGDVTGTTTVRAMGDLTRRLRIPVHVVYFSNAEQFFRYSASFRQNMASLAVDDRSLVLRTFRHTHASYPTGDRWHYVTQPFAGFVSRLEDGLPHSHALAAEVITRGPTAPGFTRLER